MKISMRRTAINIVLILAAFSIQSSLFPLIPFLSAAPNLLLILTFSFAFIEGKQAGMVYGVLAGVLMDLFYGVPLGFNTLFFVHMGYINGICTKYYYEDYITLPLILCVINELAYNLYVYIFQFLIRGRLDFFYYFRELIISDTIFTVVTTLFVYRLILFINRWLRKLESRRETTIV